MARKVPAEGECVFCGKRVDSDAYCYGCDEFVCENCDHRDPGAMGAHNVEDHMEASDD